MSEFNGLCIVSPDKRDLYAQELDAYFILRKHVLIDQRGWELTSQGGKEIDQFDHDHAHYLLYKSVETGEVLGGVRLTPTLAPNLTIDIFSHLIDPEHGFFPSQHVWESSRFVTTSVNKTLQTGVIREITLVLFIGMIEYALHLSLRSLLMLTEIRLERIGRMVHWHLNRLGKVESVGNTYAVVGLAETSQNVRCKVRQSAGIWRNVF